MNSEEQYKMNFESLLLKLLESNQVLLKKIQQNQSVIEDGLQAEGCTEEMKKLHVEVTNNINAASDNLQNIYSQLQGFITQEE